MRDYPDKIRLLLHLSSFQILGTLTKQKIYSVAYLRICLNIEWKKKLPYQIWSSHNPIMVCFLSEYTSKQNILFPHYGFPFEICVIPGMCCTSIFGTAIFQEHFDYFHDNCMLLLVSIIKYFILVKVPICGL